jgi:hypothetical protein
MSDTKSAKKHEEDSEEIVDTETVYWRHKSGKAGPFKVLTAELLHGIPDRLLATREQRVAWWNKQMRACNGDETAIAHKLANGSLQIPLNMLEHPERFEFGRELPGGRVVDPGHVGVIATEFAEYMTAKSHVCVLREYTADGELYDIHFIIDDGFHRLCARIERAYGGGPLTDAEKLTYGDIDLTPADLWYGRHFITVPVEATLVNNLTEAAASFAAKNGPKNRIATSMRTNYRHQLLAGNEETVYAVKLLAAYGLDGSCTPNKRGWPVFNQGTIIEQLLFDTGRVGAFEFVNEKDVHRTLELLTTPTNIGVYKQSKALKPQLVAGLCLFVTFLERAGFAHTYAVNYMLSRPDFLTRLRQIIKGVSKEDAVKIFTKFAPNEAVTTDDQSIRYISMAAALIKYYGELVRPAKTRAQLWPECPMECKALFNDAPNIADKINRHNFIAVRQAALNKGKKYGRAYCTRYAVKRPFTH